MKQPLTPLSIPEIQQRYHVQRSAIRRRLKEFKDVQSQEYFYELAYCLLTPQSSAVNAGNVIEMLRERDYQHRNFDPEQILRSKQHYIRFHKTKARRLQEMKSLFPNVVSLLGSKKPAQELRRWLVDNMKGLGWKEASHFLRNIGYRNLAILDRHIIKNLIRLGVLDSQPTTLTAKEYLRIENLFLEFSAQNGIPMDELDLLFWSMETGEILK